MKFDVVSFGSAVVDVFVDTDVAEHKGFMHYPVGSKILLKNVRFDVGGGGTNTAVAFSRFGLQTGFLGKVGDDSDGGVILRSLSREKISFLGKIGKNGVSGYSVILDSKAHNRTILTYKGESNNLSYNEVNLRRLKTKWMCLTPLLGESFKTQKKVVDYLSRKGTKIALILSEYLIKNVNINPLLQLSDVVVCNKEEAQMLCKKHRLRGDVLLGVHSLGPKMVVVTDKHKKIIAYDGVKRYSLVPHQKIKVVERTGAGDAFASGFIAGLIVGMSVEKSLQLGLAESESVLKYFGAKNKLLKRNLKKEMKKRR